ncbi:molybdopterin-dependent oxidoreductase, partial [Nocardia sp. NPDC057353]|uniref:molybdopterin-dependent oxidoreductase n=1 Tax=Nocardia sp. NPDC057353 TaxID=3346104 RepID=UPI003626CF67
ARGAVEAGALPGLLPGGRPVADPAARGQVAAAWGGAELPVSAGRDTAGILDAAAELRALVLGGVELDDLPDPVAARAALVAAPFVVSLELRHSDVTEYADVVFPVAAVAEKAGTFRNWEGRARPFEAALGESTVRRTAAPLPDLRVLHALAEEMRTPIGLRDVAAARAELAALGRWSGASVAAPRHDHPELPHPQSGSAILTGWRMLLDRGRMQDGEEALAGSARPAVVRLSADTAAEIGVAAGDPVTVRTAHGALTLPLDLADLPDRVVWLPWNSPGSTVAAVLRARQGEVVSIAAADGRSDA